MDLRHQESADAIRASIRFGRCDPAAFRAALSSVPVALRDSWLDRVLGLGELYEDGPELPRGCVPYLPCSVEVLLWMVEQTALDVSDVFVDIGAGAGRAMALAHLLTGASAVGIEIQAELVRAARRVASGLCLPRVSCVHGDASGSGRAMADGSVFFLYCPFSGERLARVVDVLEVIARTRELRVCCVGVALPTNAWLERAPQVFADAAIYRCAPHAPPASS